ncbi:hypothetical protein BSKO_06985 [Bryopsis sp. KO-2023]|nr:hypothetical protein BSKO_06985 [Bryopsis sp. KO-2023]
MSRNFVHELERAEGSGLLDFRTQELKRQLDNTIKKDSQPSTRRSSVTSSRSPRPSGTRSPNRRSRLEAGRRTKSLVGDRDDRDRTAALHEGKAEVNFLGEIVGCTSLPGRCGFCEWTLSSNSEAWHCQNGKSEGRTQISRPEQEDDSLTLWQHPIDVQYETQTIQGWPRLFVRVFRCDPLLGFSQLSGYGICALPNTPGTHELECNTWTAGDQRMALQEQLHGFFTAAAPRLIEESFVCDPKSRGNSAGTYTQGACKVHIRLNVLIKGLGSIANLGGDTVAHSLERMRNTQERAKKRNSDRLGAIHEHSDRDSQGVSSVREGFQSRLASAFRRLEIRQASTASVLDDYGLEEDET